MKRSIMIWTVSAIVYVGLVIAGYSVYASMNPKKDEHTNHAANDQEGDGMNQHNTHNEHAGHGESGESDVIPKVSYDNGEITIELKDKNNHVPMLEVNHEKNMHLIIVSSDLKEYHHLHPVKKNEGIYKQQINLADNAYKVFVDIKPKGLNYSVKPIDLHAGKANHEHQDNNLSVDTNFTKTINDQTVELKTTSFEVNKEITLEFDVKNTKPDPYLGALGHVVILDEDGETFIHVHPVSDDKTVFNTQFSKPGVYKLWAEFKFGNKVNAYPYVIEVK